MRFKITPLNIISAAAIMAGVVLLVDAEQFINFQVSEMKILFVVLFFMAGIVSFVSDLLFRKMIPSLKRLWIIELALITLTVVIMVGLKALIA